MLNPSVPSVHKKFNFHHLTYMAYSNSTWVRAEAAMACINKFEVSSKEKITWPLSNDTVTKFCKWAICRNRLTPATTQAYLTSFTFLHKLKLWPTDTCNNFEAKSILRGAENIKAQSPSTKRHRLAMNLPLLKFLGHQISIQNWPAHSKQVLWTAATVAFFGSLRMGELLAQNKHNFDTFSTLLWGDIKRHLDCWIIHIKSPKSRHPNGEYVDVFSFIGHNCCPVAALCKLQATSKFSSNSSLPVFMFDKNCYLTKETFNKTVQKLLEPILKENSKNITGHSFRAGIPSAMAKSPNKKVTDDIKGWGRWGSKAYQNYTRLQYDQKYEIFKSIRNILNNA